MNPIDIIQKLQEIGVKFELSGEGFTIQSPRGLVTVEMRDLLRLHKAEIVSLLRESGMDDSELAWRVAAMRSQLPESGKPFPLLVARQDISPKLGECFSCGEPLKASETGYGCGLCNRAKRLVLAMA